jgi:[acyl-carrier-protein] S-malonyltransferase
MQEIQTNQTEKRKDTKTAMAGKIALIFSGQGAQYTGMGKELYDVSPAAKTVFDMANQVRPNTKQQCFYGSKEELSQTVNTQPCLFCVGLGAAQALKEAEIEADMVAGFSLGEIPALTYAGVFSLQSGFDFVCKRAEIMQRAAEERQSSMAAILKLENSKVEELCAKYQEVYAVNYNCPGQLVVAGDVEEMEELKADVKAAGGRAIPLAVSAAFHSPFMDQAAEQLKEVLEEYTLHKPQLDVYANYTAGLYEEKNIRQLLYAQINHPVKWQQTIENMIEAGADTFIEVGAGKTLSGFIAKISTQVKVCNVEDKDSLEKTLHELKNY